MLRNTVLPIVITSAGLALGCEHSPQLASATQAREVMGTFARVTAVAGDRARAQAAVEAGYARLEDVNRLMSDYAADSEVGRLNELPAGGSLVLSVETFFCLQKAVEIARVSGGAFDVTCRPLVALWKQAARRDRLPTEDELTAVRAHIGWHKLKLEPDTCTVTLLADGIQIDLGGIAKGYALDLAAEAMRRAGAVGGLVDVGGDIVAFGKRDDGQEWRIGIRHPFEKALFGKLQVEDAAVATSGLQQRFFEIQGKRYSHILDPRTGHPVEQAPSVTVIAPDGVTADAWATVFSVLSPAEGKKLIQEKLAGIGVEVLWISGTAAQPAVEQTPGFDQYLME